METHVPSDEADNPASVAAPPRAGLARLIGSGRARLHRIGRALVIPAILVAIWLFLTGLNLVPPIILPRPGRIASVAIAIRSVLPGAIWITLQMVFGGLFLGGVTGIGSGLIFGYSRWTRDLLEFSLDALRPIPLFATIPLFILWLGIGMRPQIALVAFGVFLLLTIQTTEAVRNVPQVFVKAALTSGASRFHVYRTVVIPAILPYILAGLRLAVAGAWGLDVAAEFMGSQQGLGYLMLTRLRFVDTAGITLIVIIYAVMAIGMDFTLRRVNRRFTRWIPRGERAGVVGTYLGTAT